MDLRSDGTAPPRRRGVVSCPCAPWCFQGNIATGAFVRAWSFLRVLGASCKQNVGLRNI